MLKRGFLSYSTANDDPYYKADFYNFNNLALIKSGVLELYVFISISEVYPKSKIDDYVISKLVKIIEKNKKIKVHCCEFKSNIGRDFSSSHNNLLKIREHCQKDDYILFLNRSSYGPIKKNWYLKYVMQFEKHPNTGLCGNTINFSNHPDLPTIKGEFYTHIQTYLFLTKMKYFEEIVENFPARNIEDRLSLIKNGEIGLSKYFLKHGFSISCLFWPEKFYNSERLFDKDLPQTDIKKNVYDLPFRYKYEEYFFLNKKLRIKYIIWKIKLILLFIFEGV